VLKELGEYEVIEELGRGGMGVVYKGRHAESGDQVAIKVLPAQLALDPAFRQRFIREVKTLERLEHPNIVRILGSGHHEGALWYAMEFVDGTDLEHVLRADGKLDPLRATRIVRAVAEALAYSHTRNVIHRDIKPANVMLAGEDQVKLTDFGIARMVDATRMTVTAGVLGTVEYMSPEQSEGEVVDERTDIYSLGVVFYRAVTGRLPVDGANPTEIMVRIKTAQVSAPISWVPDLPRNLNDLILQMVEKDRSRRILSAQALLRELERNIRQLEAAAAGFEVGSEAILSEREAVPVWWKNPWLILFVVFVAAIAGWRILDRPPAPGMVIAQAEQLADEGTLGEARGMLAELLDRDDLTPKQQERAKELKEQLDEQAKVQGLAARLWSNAGAARRQNKHRVELRLILLIMEEMPGTKHAELARQRLADSLTLQKLLKELRPDASPPPLE